MKTHNLELDGDHASGITRGHRGGERAGGDIQVSDPGGTTVVTQHIILVRGTVTYDDEGNAIIDVPGAVGTVSDGTTTATDVETITVPPGGLVDLGGGAVLLRYLTNVWGEQHTLFTTTASGAALTLDLSAYNTFDVTLTANCTLTFSNPPVSGVHSEWTLILRQGNGAGPATVTWPAAVDFQDTDGTGGGADPTLYTAFGAVDVITITTLDGGTTYGVAQERAGGSASPLTTKGDLWGYDTADARVPVGTNGYLLVADSTDVLGVVWEDPETTGHWEVLMDGAGAPLDNGSGLDWLYVWVS